MRLRPSRLAAPLCLLSVVHCSSAPEPLDSSSAAVTAGATAASPAPLGPMSLNKEGEVKLASPAASAQGDVFGYASVWSSQFCKTGETCKLADVNGDGKADILAFTHNATPQVWVGLSNGESFGAPQLWSSYFCASTETCDVGDFDGDGKADVIAFTRSSPPSAFVALSNGSNGFGAPQRWSSFFCQSGEVCKVADMNGDRKADIVAFTHNATPQLYVALSSGSGFGGAALWSSFFCKSTETCDVGDVDGDGKADAIAFTPSATQVWAGLSTGSSLASPQLWSSHTCRPGEVCTVADVTGDGKADVVVFTHSTTPQVYVAGSSGTAFYDAAMWDDFFCKSTETCMLGDVTGDGLPDVAATTGAPNDQTWIAKNGMNTRLLYHGGPLMEGTTNVYLIFYGSWQNLTTPSLVSTFVANLSGSPYWNINGTYTDASGAHASTQLSFGGRTYVGYTHGNNLQGSDIVAIVNEAGVPAFGADPNGIYLVVTSADVAQGGMCSTYCGWHNAMQSGTTTLKYAFIGSPARCPGACAPQWAVSPNNDPEGDGMVNVIAHELTESITDPTGQGWFAGGGTEDGDACAWTFGIPFTTSNGAEANLTLHGASYLVQQNFAVGKNVCSMTPN